MLIQSRIPIKISLVCHGFREVFFNQFLEKNQTMLKYFVYQAFFYEKSLVYIGVLGLDLRVIG